MGGRLRSTYYQAVDRLVEAVEGIQGVTLSDTQEPVTSGAIEQ